MALQVALAVPLPRAFDYLPPAGACPGPAWIGRRVRVPFGSGERVGLVVGVGPPSEVGIPLRPAVALLDDAPLLGDELLSTLRFCARYYHAPLGEVLGMALPVGLREGQVLPDTLPFAWRLTEAGATALGGLRPGAPRRLAERLLAGGAPEALLDQDPGWRAAARKLAARTIPTRPNRHRRSNRHSTRCVPTRVSIRSCSKASPAAARPRCTCRRSAIACAPVARPWCWYRRSA